MGLVFSPRFRSLKLWVPLGLFNLSGLCINSWVTAINFSWVSMMMIFVGVVGVGACVGAVVVIRRDGRRKSNIA